MVVAIVVLDQATKAMVKFRLPLHESVTVIPGFFDFTHVRNTRYGLALILGGAIGNLIDRATMGYVVDFVDVYWRGVHFWAFNVADSAITVGVALMLLDVLGVGRVPETV
jgi:lipoprotein signal peptidase